MKSPIAKSVLTATLALAAYYPAQAGSLQVEPVLVDVTAPGAASTVSLRNEGTTPISAQIRVFRWSLVDGKEKLEPTDEVVASPPSITLTPNGQYVTRIVRVSKQPVTGEESYRLLVDQLPDLSQQKNGTVNLLMRYSIPVFFGASNKKNPTVAWSYAIKGDKITLTARNDGERRLRISALTVRDAGGKTVSFGAGLAGYALGRSTISWTVPSRGFSANGSASIAAQSDGGPIQAVAVASR
jgi:fimbrial chaperone protein